MIHTATHSSHTYVARILIVDDHPIVRDGLVAALSRHPDLRVCGEAASIAEAIKLIDQGLGSSEIAQRLHLGVKTIETHRQRIKGKLDLKSGQELVRHATQWVLENH